jgi:hypothetical protein
VPIATARLEDGLIALPPEKDTYSRERDSCSPADAYEDAMECDYAATERQRSKNTVIRRHTKAYEPPLYGFAYSTTLGKRTTTREIAPLNTLRRRIYSVIGY